MSSVFHKVQMYKHQFEIKFLTHYAQLLNPLVSQLSSGTTRTYIQGQKVSSQQTPEDSEKSFLTAVLVTNAFTNALLTKERAREKEST